jgi:hypothetical protein
MLEEASGKILTKIVGTFINVDEKLLETLKKKCCNIFEKYRNILNFIIIKWASGKIKNII